MNVSFINFPDNDSLKLQKILQLSKINSYQIQPYNKQSQTDLLFFYGENYLQQEEFNSLPKEQYSRVIIVAKQAPAENMCHYISLPLIASRVLNVVDKINTNQTNVNNVVLKPEMSEKVVINSTFKSDYVSDNFEDGEKLNLRILVVDDSVPMQKALAAEIKRLDKPTEIDFAGTGEEALEYADKHRYDFIFLDIIMPGIDGFETCTRMRKQAKLKKVPIIMLSAKTSPLDEVKGVMAGCTTYMTKPIVHEEFQKVIRRITKWVENTSKKSTIN